MEQGSVRNLEQIQESDGERTPRGVTILLVALGGACIVFAGLAIGGRHSAPTAAKVDPLGELVTQHAKIAQGGAPAPKATDLSTHEVTFPGILSDEGSPTTALAAVKGGGPKAPTTGTPPSSPAGTSATGVVAAAPFAPAPVAPAAPFAATEPTAAITLNVRGSDPGNAAPSGERLPVVPLPAQNMLGASPVVTRPRDSLTKAASEAESASNAGPAAPAGREGGYQLQVSSFRTQGEADTFSGQLRARGHKAYVVEAHVPGRGTWYRVRIGPFTSQHAAASYRAGFEGREHVVPFIVPPTK
ncbi:MAG: Adventurous gliding motility protein [Labilithrix sp.]|jgi:cell division septation protein DedD|nr:Adventurous gliding motility protein [Labilithrix sp.]